MAKGLERKILKHQDLAALVFLPGLDQKDAHRTPGGSQATGPPKPLSADFSLFLILL
jgi:hypothetical protein